MDNLNHIIESCKKGNRAGCKRLYQIHLPYILTIVRRYGIKQSDHADMVQEIFTELFICLPNFDAAKAGFSTWARTIAVRKILNNKRIQNRLYLVDSNDKELESPTIDFLQIDIEYIITAIQKLPDGYQTIFNMYEIDGFSHKEIAKILGITASSSRSQLTRAKMTLKKSLSHLDECKTL